jgi:glycosyltransferase involved in cell wall biosynthesis
MPARLQLVVPCYNEARRLKPDAFLEFVNRQSDAQLLFVDDGSADGTTPAALAQLAVRGAGKISVVTLSRNMGKTLAIQHGVLKAFERGSELVGYWDADLSTPLDAVHEFIEILDADPDIDIVIGARVRLLGRQIDRRPLRHYCGRLFGTAVSLGLGIGVYDTQCGAKIFRANAAVRRAFDTPFRSRWLVDVEMLSRYISESGTRAAERRIYELPLKQWTETPGSHLGPWQVARAVWDLARVGRASRSRPPRPRFNPGQES